MIYSKKLVDKICYNSRLGLSRDECFIGVVPSSTFYDWLRKRKEFKQAIELAEFQVKRDALTSLKKGMWKDPRWGAWLLERKYRDEFALKVVQEFEKPIVVDMPEETKDLIKQAVKYALPENSGRPSKPRKPSQEDIAGQVIS